MIEQNALHVIQPPKEYSHLITINPVNAVSKTSDVRSFQAVCSSLAVLLTLPSPSDVDPTLPSTARPAGYMLREIKDQKLSHH